MIPKYIFEIPLKIELPSFPKFDLVKQKAEVGSHKTYG